ncbi:MAG TPA: sodium-dependent transporter [Gammaproteobacteria bacterium]|nr:sodium-dependent transporter [Gammaproteobacteria bacterium]HJM08947.1 sodium-dependent transporter [Gammaproteobacteria bacterium]
MNNHQGNQERTSLHGQWSSRLTFILAVTGSAIGLGNIWKFPYIAGENGGGAFVLIYLVCIFLIGFPIMVSELMLGRKGRRNPITSMKILGQEEHGNQNWKWVGLIGLTAGFIILSYYSVIAGWTLHYFKMSLLGELSNLDNESAQSIFNELTSSAATQLIYHTAFMAITIAIIAKGIKEGLERAVKLMMPGLLIILVILLFYSISQGDFMAGVNFLLKPDFSKVTSQSILAAMGQAFFTLSLGMGCIVMYGAYLPKNESIIGTTTTIIFCDTLIALLAGLVIFPIVFQFGLKPTDGPGLIFLTLPLAFSEISGGYVFSGLFFILLAFAAITSALSLLEPSVAWMIENKNYTRGKSALIIGVLIWLLGLLSIFSFNLLSGLSFWKGTLFDNLDYLSSNILLPVSGLLFTIFASWIMKRKHSLEELSDVSRRVYSLWRFSARYIAPVGVILVFLNAIGII